MCRKWFGLEQKLVPFRSAAAFGVRRDAGSPLLVSLLLSHCQERTGGDARDLLPLLQPAAPKLPPPARLPARLRSVNAPAWRDVTHPFPPPPPLIHGKPPRWPPKRGAPARAGCEKPPCSRSRGAKLCRKVYDEVKA